MMSGRADMSHLRKTQDRTQVLSEKNHDELKCRRSEKLCLFIRPDIFRITSNLGLTHIP